MGKLITQEIHLFSSILLASLFSLQDGRLYPLGNEDTMIQSEFLLKHIYLFM